MGAGSGESMTFVSSMERIVQIFELVGVAVLALGGVIGFLRYGLRYVRREQGDSFGILRHDIGRAILLGLENGQLGKYLTDFPVQELMGNDKVVPIPHLGASTEEAEENCAIMVADQLIDFLENGNIKNSVNFPSITLERNGGCRIAFSNRNVPKMLNQVLSVLADQELNVIDMINKSRDEVAYNIIDIDREPTEELVQALEAIDGVIKVRIL